MLAIDIQAPTHTPSHIMVNESVQKSMSGGYNLPLGAPLNTASHISIFDRLDSSSPQGKNVANMLRIKKNMNSGAVNGFNADKVLPQVVDSFERISAKLDAIAKRPLEIEQRMDALRAETKANLAAFEEWAAK